jgi:uncharacterized HAD superfamily protein
MNNLIYSRRIGVDIDGVVRNLYHPLCDVFKQYFKSVEFDPIEKWTNYKIWNHFRNKKTGKVVDEKWFKDIWFRRHADYIYFRASFCYPYATEVLKKQRDKGHKIIFITAQPSRYTMGLTLNFMSKWRIPFDEIHFTDYESKYNVDCDIYVEDSPYQIQRIGAGKTTSHVWIYDQPWNKIIINPGYKRFNSWLEIDKELNRRFQ